MTGTNTRKERIVNILYALETVETRRCLSNVDRMSKSGPGGIRTHDRPVSPGGARRLARSR